ncbi:hypothetical protein D9M72_576190 [compost metagenome]
MLGTAWAVIGRSVGLCATKTISFTAPGWTTSWSDFGPNSQTMSMLLLATNCTFTSRPSSTCCAPACQALPDVLPLMPSALHITS